MTGTGAAPRFAPTRDATEQIALAIRRYLEENDLQPGDRIGTEQQLAVEFGVSRPTLREAIKLLASSHLVRASKGRGGGIFVGSTPNEGMGRNVSESIATMLATDSVSLRQLLATRVFLEVPLAGLAAENADAATVAHLEAAIAEAEGHRPESDPFRIADTRFHQVLANAAGNDLLLAFTGWILEVLQPSLVVRIAAQMEGRLIIDQHWTIVRAVRRGSRTAAERAMRAHLAYVGEILAAAEG